MCATSRLLFTFIVANSFGAFALLYVATPLGFKIQSGPYIYIFSTHLLHFKKSEKENSKLQEKEMQGELWMLRQDSLLSGLPCSNQ